MVKYIVEIVLFAFWLWYGQWDSKQITVERLALTVWVGGAALLAARWLAPRIKLGWRFGPAVMSYGLAIVIAVLSVRLLWPTPQSPAPSEPALSQVTQPVIIQTVPPPPTAEEIAEAIIKRQPKPEPVPRKDEPAPWLTERYPESWFPPDPEQPPGSLIIYEGFQMPTAVGTHQRFTPAVHAPDSTALSAVTLAICVPGNFKWDPNSEWVHQETGRCAPNHARYTTYFERIARGVGLNPRQSFFFWPTEAGEFLVKYWITSAELAPFESYFYVNVAKP